MRQPKDWTRRDFVAHSALALPALAALPRLARAEPAPGTPPEAAHAGRPPLRVVVVGAGLAGLAAAHDLVSLGHSVTVLEATPQAGGRIVTVRQPFAEGIYAEGGAMDFSDGYRNLLHYVKALNVPTTTLTEPTSVIFYFRGKRMKFALTAGRAAEPEWPFKLSPEEKTLGLGGMFAKYFAVVDKIGEPTAPGWKLDPWKSYDDVSLSTFLASQGATAEAIELLGDSFSFGYGWSQVSALHRLLSDVALFCLGQPRRVISGGTDRLTQAFAAALGDRIRYGVPVVRVAQLPGKVRVVFRHGEAEEWLDADRLVCTAPCPALRRISFTPQLPAAKRQIMDQLEYLPVMRIYLQLSRRVWAAEGVPGSAQTDLPTPMVTEHPEVMVASQGERGIIECQIRGPEAVRLGALEPEARLAFAKENLDRVFPGVKSHFEVGTSVDWTNNPWAGGAYAWWHPGQLTTWMPELAKPEGRVHFAGEHTSLLGRTMEGAAESGARVAREVHAAPRPLSALAE